MNVDLIRKTKSKELRALRDQSRLTQDQLAVLSGLGQATISRMERGLQTWTIDCELMFREGIRKYMENKKSA